MWFSIQPLRGTAVALSRALPRQSTLLGFLAVVIAILLLAPQVQAAPPCKYGYDPAGNCREEPPPQPQTTMAPVRIESTPPGAEVLGVLSKAVTAGQSVPDGSRTLGHTPFNTLLQPGSYILVFRLAAHVDFRTEVTVRLGQPNKVIVSLEKLPTITVTPKNAAADGAYLSIDGTMVGKLPVQDLVLPSLGVHVLKVERDNCEPWTTSETFAVGTRRIFGVKLEFLQGRLLVGSGGDDEIFGATVILDPDPASTELENRWGRYIGHTPAPPKVVDAGTHVIRLEMDGLDPITMFVHVTANQDHLLQPLSIAPKRFYGVVVSDKKLWEEVDWERVEKDCLRENGRVVAACTVAGYRYSHGDRVDLKKAERMYQAGCTAGSRQACLSVGYLVKKREESEKKAIQKEYTKSDAWVWFDKACRTEGEPADACWYQYISLKRMPDPTRDAGDWRSYVPSQMPVFRRVPDFEVGALAGVGPFVGTPVYWEPFFGIRMDINSWAQVSSGLSLRARLVGRIDDTRSRQDWVFQLAPSFDLGFMLTPLPRKSLTIRPMVRFTPYVNATSAFGGGILIGHAFGKHLVEAGVLVDMMPLHVEPVRAFGQSQLYEKQEVMPIVCLRYAYWGLTDKL